MFAGSAAFVIICLTSCGAGLGLDPMAPTDGNFKKAIDAFLAAERDPNDTGEPHGKACLQLEGALPFNMPRYHDFSELKPFESAGLLRSSDVMVRSPGFIPGVDHGTSRMKRFEATEAGGKIFTLAKAEYRDGQVSQACWANLRVNTIVKWFKLPDGSYTVQWTYQVLDVADWAKRPEIATGVREIKWWVDQQKKEVYEAILVLSNKGWETRHVWRRVNP